MTLSEMERLLIESVKRIQSVSGRADVHVHGNTRPFLDIDEFDSLNGVELTVELIERLKFQPSFNNVLAAENKALSITEASRRLLSEMQTTVAVE